MSIRQGLRDIKNHLAHFMAGLLAGFFIIYLPLFSYLLTFLFLAYEYSENRIVHDKMFPEIKEYTVGYVLGLIIDITLNSLYGINYWWFR